MRVHVFASSRVNIFKNTALDDILLAERMEPENSSLLELPMEGADILDEVELSKAHISTQDVECHESVEILMAEPETQHENISCITSGGMDFEFSNSDLVHGAEFGIDNTAIFGIPENDIEVERAECEDLFQDTSCFNVNVSKPDDVLTSSNLTVLSGTEVATSYKDIGLRLQIIPLDNLQYVSTVQTDKGLHILAVPADASVNLDQQEYLKNITETLKQIPPNNIDHVPSYVVNFCNERVKFTNSNNHCQTKIINMFDRGAIESTTVGDSVVNNGAKGNCSYASNSEINYNESTNVTSRKPMVSLLKNVGFHENLERKVNEKRKPAGSVKLTIPLTAYVNPSSEGFRTNHVVKTSESFIDTGAVLSQNKTQGAAGEQEKIKQILTGEKVKKDIVACSEMGTTELSDWKSNQHQNETSAQNTYKPQNSVTKSSTLFSVKSSKMKKSDKKYCCTECPAKYSKEGHLKNHMFVHSQISKLNTMHRVDSALQMNEKEISEENKNTLLGNESSDGLEDGGETRRSVIDKQEHDLCNREWETLECEICGMSFKTPGNLTRHLLTHTRESGVSLD